MTTLTVLPFDPQSASPHELEALAQLLVEAHAFAYPEDPPRRVDTEVIELGLRDPNEEKQLFVVWDGPQVIGYGSIAYDTTQNLHLAFCTVVVHPSQRRRGLGRGLFGKLSRVARELGRLTLNFSTSSKAPAGVAFAQSLQAQPALPMRLSQLELSRVQAEMMYRWQERPAAEPYRLHTWTTIPEPYLERMAEMMMVMNTAPKGELDIEDWLTTPDMIRSWESDLAAIGETKFTMVIEHTPSGQLEGYTEVYWNPQRAALVYQGATAVRPSARGLGLGKWLKGAMAQHVRTHCPGAKFIRTGNAHSNAAMLAINVAMGFEPWAENVSWQLKLS